MGLERVLEKAVACLLASRGVGIIDGVRFALLLRNRQVRQLFRGPRGTVIGDAGVEVVRFGFGGCRQQPGLALGAFGDREETRQDIHDD